MDSDNKHDEVRKLGERMAACLELSAAPVGIRLLSRGEPPEGAAVLNQHRNCQSVMKARKGEIVYLDAQEISCPAAAFNHLFSRG